MASDQQGELSTFTGARQTMMSWSRVVEGWDDVPEVFRAPYRTVVTEGGGSTPPYTVFAPAMAGPSLKLTGPDPNPKLLCELGDTIYLWEHAGDRVSMIAYPLKDISDLEVGKIHLYSWITIGGMTQDGLARSTTVEYNQATARHFAPFVNKIRPAPRDVDEREERAERHKVDYLGSWSLKFRNYALESLVGGDQIVQTLWQPELSRPVLKIGKHVFVQTTLSLAHASILTDRELIIIQDDERSRKSRGVRYGGKWRYVALSHIGGVSLLDDAGDLVRLSLTLAPGGRQMEIAFSASRKELIAQLQDELEKRIG